MDQNRYFKLFANCIPVKGYKRSIVCDLQNGGYIYIPNKLYPYLVGRSRHNTELGEELGTQAGEIFQYFDQLRNLNFGHFTSEPSLFPDLPGEYVSPYEIHDCIIELSEFNYMHFLDISCALAKLGVACLEFRAFSNFSLLRLSEMLKMLEETRVRNVEIFMPFDLTMNVEAYQDFLLENKIIGSLVVYGSSMQSRRELEGATLLFIKEHLSNSDCCGNISEETFVFNTKFYLETLRFNNCLYKKLSINSKGELMNCPSLKKTFGNILDRDIWSVIHTAEFKKLGEVTKDQIAICKDCEFRYICSDCRAFVGEKEKPAKCAYEPYAD